MASKMPWSGPPDRTELPIQSWRPTAHKQESKTNKQKSRSSWAQEWEVTGPIAMLAIVKSRKLTCYWQLIYDHLSRAPQKLWLKNQPKASPPVIKFPHRQSLKIPLTENVKVSWLILWLIPIVWLTPFLPAIAFCALSCCLYALEQLITAPYYWACFHTHKLKVNHMSQWNGAQKGPNEMRFLVAKGSIAGEKTKLAFRPKALFAWILLRKGG